MNEFKRNRTEINRNKSKIMKEMFNMNNSATNL